MCLIKRPNHQTKVPLKVGTYILSIYWHHEEVKGIDIWSLCGTPMN
jgi:hypothetical protein